MNANRNHINFNKRDVLNNIVAISGVITPDGRLIDINRAALQAANLKPKDVLGKPFEDCYWWSWSPEVQQRLREAIKRALEGRRSRYDEVIRIGEGRFRTIDFMLAPIFSQDGRVSYLIPSATDITERKRAEEALRQLNETLEQRVSERTELAEERAKQLRVLVSELTLAEHRERQRLAEILHDRLQQPLIAAKINSEVLSAGLGADQKQTADQILGLINESIRTSRSLTAELSLPSLQQGRLSAALEWLARWMQEYHGLTVDLQTDQALDPEREDSAVLLFQSVRELLLNVIQHAGVKAARVEMTRENDNRLRLSVADRGRGLDPEAAWEKTKAGMGFGLFTIRERLEMLGGSLEIVSSPENGASFVLVLPIEATRREDAGRIAGPGGAADTAWPSGEKIRILLADDHTVVRQGLSTMLNLYSDIEVIGEASNGEEAVEMARKLQPDLILMDISMPKMNGLEATRIIHAELPHIRIIGLSMHNGDDMAGAMIAAGAAAYCTKDGATRLLLSAIRGEAEGSGCEKKALAEHDPSTREQG